jgi:hypothetical protein
MAVTVAPGVTAATAGVRVVVKAAVKAVGRAAVKAAAAATRRPA